jgi:hypothetical protein
MGESVDRVPVVVGKGDDVGQIHFSLAVGGSDHAQGFEQEFPVHQIDAGIDLLYPALIGIGIFFFNDRGHLFVVIGYDPPIAVRVGDQGGHKGQHRVHLLMVVDHGVNGFGADKRSVAAEDQDGICPGAGLFRAEHRMAGAQLFLLDDRAERVLPQGSKNTVLLVPYHDGCCVDLRPLNRVHDMMDHRAEKDLVQDLGPAGFHPGSLTGGKYDSGDVVHRRKIVTSKTKI